MSKFGNDLVQGPTEAVAFARLDKAGARVHVVEVPDARAIHRRRHMSQHEFADTFHIPLATLKNWQRVVVFPMLRPWPICR
jgi:DNA-binding transcriptional regulator YiaG